MDRMMWRGLISVPAAFPLFPIATEPVSTGASQSGAGVEGDFDTTSTHAGYQITVIKKIRRIIVQRLSGTAILNIVIAS